MGMDARPHPNPLPRGRGARGLLCALCNTHGEDAPVVDPLFDLGKPAVLHQLIEFLLRAPAHHPGFAVAMAGERARDEFELRVPWLPGVNKVTARRHGARQAAQG